MKIINTAALIAVAFIAPFTSVFAQEEMEVSAIEARKVLTEMTNQTKKCSTIYLEFTASYENKRTGNKHSCDGTLKVKGEKYVLDVSDMVTYSEEDKVSVWQKKINELDISSHDEEAEGEMTPAKLFGGAYQEGYKLRMLGDKKVGGEECVEVDLYPKDTKSPIMRIRLSISKKTKMLKRFMQQYKLGESLTVDIKTFTPNKPMADKEFSFDSAAHKDVEIVDLR